MITIFTPTYNRAYIIGKLYVSLCAQTCKDFEWLIVDDGSMDDTKSLIQSFILQEKIAIRYICQDNRGKHCAINRGVKEAVGELFFIVDSDDILVNQAVEIIMKHYLNIKGDDSFAGVCGLRAYFDGTRICHGNYKFTVLDCNCLDFKYKYKFSGDMADVFRTEIIRAFPFPEIDGEKFCPEALVWSRIAMKYKMRYFHENIYLCEYLPDGLTAKITKLRMQNPKASMIFYSERYHRNIPLIHKVRAAINYWRFACCSGMRFSEKIRQIGVNSLWLYPLGILFYLKDLRS